MKIFKRLWQGWKRIAHKIGVFQSKVILTVFYFLLTPFGLLFTYFKDELKMKKLSHSTWNQKNKHSQSLADLKNQY
ncbi:hypothetical protein A3D05_03230 [Candidatus Gottesmanbacteria bacterium RIFCSPHIGHO2_02_FULL_40_24]|uniref:Uncharacterized protein n=1 Tax=Candidatus Gottesmanbacteria bacterium RIFCSPHIGHO2_01_FULL_40_15 TaxID=1798376 RepID=A0A1F5Z0B3_9BACT|nr:MAG: hypothetical protein A2777_04810 [Candidatus Gottesmanbacteria bacterium RIFCSPHIGHO2_01_FULL_40_15]OGG17705.1 MAG: hypothetical protein A3D05_03230 [Candidatus Gottesmanbacteria bacterium RIFCSPHIGHO2_02_FULL_40_24]OGG21620.1 MAG: hypothetical protein A3B48_04910 [Candidatus Gottesmanbacteria bacterium RIFCSPLOWO2_01_FULL_40_10]OGG24812.1 MAG: hypothetical protein A3E42_02460 [Candidatus Gottesmanbacteria bacterium RIFCSPHIGHO2_12_FULL_40_13]OGG33093.1 MAG: hypothetical protein A3I80_0